MVGFADKFSLDNLQSERDILFSQSTKQVAFLFAVTIKLQDHYQKLAWVWTWFRTGCYATNA